MPNLVDSAPGPNKAIVLGDSGSGKSGAKACLIAFGYKVRSLDTDNGNKLLRALLTDERYPYAEVARQRNVDLREAFHFMPISTPTIVRTIKHSIKTSIGYAEVAERMLTPKDGKAWSRIVEMLAEWKDDELGINYGPVDTWDDSCVLDIDSFTTVSRQAYYMNQEFNGRLGAAEEGYTHQKDVGGAQSQLRRLLETLFNPAIKCHVLLNGHIYRIDDSRGYNQTPEQRKMENPEAVLEIKGFPQSVGMQLSKNTPIYFNDSFVLESRGSGEQVTREIKTVPTSINGVIVPSKSSAWLKKSYDQRTGLLEIFHELQQKEAPKEIVDFIKNYKPPGAAVSVPKDGLPNPVVVVAARR